jgi:hypothetical protein
VVPVDRTPFKRDRQARLEWTESGRYFIEVEKYQQKKAVACQAEIKVKFFLLAFFMSFMKKTFLPMSCQSQYLFTFYDSGAYFLVQGPQFNLWM